MELASTCTVNTWIWCDCVPGLRQSKDDHVTATNSGVGCTYLCWENFLTSVVHENYTDDIDAVFQEGNQQLHTVTAKRVHQLLDPDRYVELQM